jgi:hypothetical protein
LGGINCSLRWKNILKDILILIGGYTKDGLDPVDATRTMALAAGPFVQRGALVSALKDLMDSDQKLYQQLLGIRRF